MILRTIHSLDSILHLLQLCYCFSILCCICLEIAIYCIAASLCYILEASYLCPKAS
jgi:hypothetical protein